MCSHVIDKVLLVRTQAGDAGGRDDEDTVLLTQVPVIVYKTRAL